MKKTLKITAIVLGSLLAIMVILPLAFKGKIKDIVIKESNSMLNAQLDFKDLKISLLRNFPSATVSLTDVVLIGVEPFAGDTLLNAERISATMDLFSIFGDDGYKLTKVMVSQTHIRTIMLEDGRANWDIMKSSTDTISNTAQSDSSFELVLKKVVIKNCTLTFEDRASKLFVGAENIDMVFSGNLSLDQTKMKINTTIGGLTVKSGGAIAYLKDAVVSAKMEVDADLKESKYTLLQNEITLNAISTRVDGWFSMPDSGGFDMDLKLATEKINFKDIISLIPAVYAADFKSVQATGSVVLDGWARGLYKDDLLPAFSASVKVEEGTFRYPSLPKGVEAINVTASATNIGGTADLTVVDVQRLTFNFAGNPFAASMHLSTPISDPNFALTAKGKIDLAMVKEVYPIQDTKLNGTLNADMAMAGRMSYIERGQYDRFTASGTLRVADLTVAMADMPVVEVAKSLLRFNSQYLDLSETTVKIGRSDITADCRFENYVAYVLKDKTIKGTMNVRSNLMDLDQLLGTSAATTTADTVAMTAFVVPKNIDLNVNASLKKAIYSKIEMDNVAGNIAVNGGTLNLKNLSINTMGGNVVASGSYSTARNEKTPDMDMSFRMSDVVFAKVFGSLPTVAKFAPIFEHLDGAFSASFGLKGVLGNDMSPVLNTLTGGGSLTTKGVVLSGIAALDMVADAVKYDKLKNMAVKDLKVDFTIKDGRIATKPFDIKAGELTMNLVGSTGIDQTIDYTGRVAIPKSAGVIAMVGTVPLKIGGTFTSPKVSIDTKSMVADLTQTLTNRALEEVGSKLGVDIGDLQKQKQSMVDAAKAAGTKLVDEAQKQADDLVGKANNPIAKVAAKIAADRVVKEAQKKADELVIKATAEGDKLLEKAN